uniref:Pecanex-like protein n=1 Tax=Apis cerana TaxID=7461 RepID=V9IKX5_APICE
MVREHFCNWYGFSNAGNFETRRLGEPDRRLVLRSSSRCFFKYFSLIYLAFLLCLPFTIYLYFPPTLYVWIAYCSSIGALFGTIKCVNHALHCMYDTTECLEESSQTISQHRSENEKRRQQ